MSAWTDDAFFVGRQIALRLKDQVPAFREVELVDELDSKDGEPNRFPAAVLVLDSLQPATREEARTSSIAEHRWLVLVAVKTARAAADRNAREAGPLIPACITALQGWQVPRTQRVLAWTRGPRPSYGKEVSYYPLAFTVSVPTV